MSPRRRAGLVLGSCLALLPLPAGSATEAQVATALFQIVASAQPALGSSFALRQGESKTISLARASIDLNVKVAATWQTDLLGGGALNPVDLRLKVVDGGTLANVKGRTGVSANVKIHKGGPRWTIEITNPNTITPRVENVKVTITASVAGNS